MLQRFTRAAPERFADDSGTWLLVQEHSVTDRIADLMIARVDEDALQVRLAAWTRPLGLTEVRALRHLRSDRGATADWIASKMRVTIDHARALLRRLEREEMVERTMSGSYAKRISLRPALRTVVTFELKREGWRRALVQARAHQSFADRCYVVFDAASKAFAANRDSYRQVGIGLLAFCAATQAIHQTAPSRASKFRDATLALFNSERVLARMLGQPVTRLPQASLPGAAGEIADPEPPTLIGNGISLQGIAAGRGCRGDRWRTRPGACAPRTR